MKFPLLKKWTGLLYGGVALFSAGSASAVTLDLTAGLNTGVINGAVFTNSNVGSTGTGVISSFVRLAQSGNNTTAEGYNATVRPVMPDVNTSPTFTHDLLLSSVPLTNVAGHPGLFYEFLLDINQQGADPLLSLDRLAIYTRPTALLQADDTGDLTAGSVLRYNIDAGDSTNRILLNYNFNNGSGSGDLFAYIPQSAFGPTTDFVYLFSAFGESGGVYAENDGFEEWAVPIDPAGLGGRRIGPLPAVLQ